MGLGAWQTAGIPARTSLTRVPLPEPAERSPARCGRGPGTPLLLPVLPPERPVLLLERPSDKQKSCVLSVLGPVVGISLEVTLDVTV